MTPRQQWHERIAAAGDVTKYLQGWEQLRSMHPEIGAPEGWKYQSFHDLVLKLGQSYTYTPDIPKGVERGPMKECFANALHAVMHNKDLLYVEGFASGIIPVHHAWVTEDRHHAIEVTWEHEADYHGIAFDTDWLMAHLVKKGTYGVFDEMVNPDWLENGMPPGAVA